MPEPTDAKKMALDDAELMRVWGALNAEWDDIELWLYNAFDSMVDDSDLITRAIFYSQKSHAARRDMVERVAQVFFGGNEKHARPLKNAILQVKARSNARNELAHGDWVAVLRAGAPRVEVERITMTTDMQSTLNSARGKADLARIADEMQRTAKALREAVLPYKVAKDKKWNEIMMARQIARGGPQAP